MMIVYVVMVILMIKINSKLNQKINKGHDSESAWNQSIENMDLLYTRENK